jgi:AcrR family transcriptional regulator
MPKGRFSRDKNKKIDKILETFKELVNKNGYEKLSTRHIAKVAGISVGIIYHYFPTGKPSIAMRYLERLTQSLFKPSMFLTAQNVETRKKLYSDFIRGQIELHRKNLEIHRALDQAILGNEEVRKHNADIIRLNLKSSAEELIQKGMYQKIPAPEVIKRFIVNFKLIEAVVHRHILVEPFFESDEELTDFLSEILLLLHKNDDKTQPKIWEKKFDK